MSAREGFEWRSDGAVARRFELYSRAAPLFRKHGYRGTTLKALARVCGLSIPALYTYFPSKKSFALFPLVALYPQLHEPAPDLTSVDPRMVLAGWVYEAVVHMPEYVLALRLAQEAGLDPGEQERISATLAGHVSFLARTLVSVAPHLDEGRATDLAQAMIDMAVATGVRPDDPEPDRLARQLRRLLASYGVPI